MKTAVISVSLHSKTFEDRFPIDSETKEYEIADRAFQLALMFVQTRAIAERGRKPSGYEFGKLLEETEYNYKIEEINDNEAVDDRYQEELESWLSYYVEPEEE